MRCFISRLGCGRRRRGGSIVNVGEAMTAAMQEQADRDRRRLFSLIEIDEGFDAYRYFRSVHSDEPWARRSLEREQHGTVSIRYSGTT